MSTLRFQVGATVTPGDRLGSLRSVTPGVGTYARGGHVFSSSVGKLELDDASKEVSVQSSKPPATNQVLVKGQLVLCRVSRIMLQQVAVEIVAAASCQQLQHKPEATIRREDVRQGASSDELKLETCFRPGDWVLARIVSLGDSRRYLISTAETELGVVRAVSQAGGHAMKPVSWKEMECPDTGRKEPRKVAKASQETLQQVLTGVSSNNGK